MEKGVEGKRERVQKVVLKEGKRLAAKKKKLV